MPETRKCGDCGKELAVERNKRGGGFVACRKKDGGCGYTKLLGKVKASGEDKPATAPAEVPAPAPAPKSGDGGKHDGGDAGSGKRHDAGDYIDRIFFRRD